MKLKQELTPQTPSVQLDSSEPDENACITLAWLELLVTEWHEENGDEWLYLCDDISEGELYKDWFLWQDREVTGNWEAYDPIDNTRYTAPDIQTLKTKIDSLEAMRNSVSHPPLRNIA